MWVLMKQHKSFSPEPNQKPGPEVIIFFMHNCSTQLSMKFQLLIKTYMLKMKDFSCFQTPMYCIFMLINVKMPTIVDILAFMSMMNFMLSCVEPKKIIISGPDFV